jgi:hypothetical protein
MQLQTRFIANTPLNITPNTRWKQTFVNATKRMLCIYIYVDVDVYMFVDIYHVYAWLLYVYGFVISIKWVFMGQVMVGCFPINVYVRLWRLNVEWQLY